MIHIIWEEYARKQLVPPRTYFWKIILHSDIQTLSFMLIRKESICSPPPTFLPFYLRSSVCHQCHRSFQSIQCNPMNFALHNVKRMQCKKTAVDCSALWYCSPHSEKKVPSSVFYLHHFTITVWKYSFLFKSHLVLI